MPAPDPHGISEGENWPRDVLVEQWGCGNQRHRKACALRILGNARWGEWTCRECGDPVPFTRRADAIYCREGCRKAAQRMRRKTAQ